MKKRQFFIAAILLAMRITIVQVTLTFILISSLYAGKISGQDILDKKISISADKLEISKVLQKVQLQTGVNFLYSPNTIQADRKISFSVADEKLGIFIDEVIRPLSIDYKVMQDQILLFPAGSSPATGMDGSAGTSPESLQTNYFFLADNIVNGTITDESGSPLAGATVMVKSKKSLVTTTDNTGSFRLDIGSPAAVLVVSYTGFKPQEIRVTASQSIAVKLSVSETSLDAVVVTGYSRQSKRDVTGAVSTVSADVVAKTPVTDVGSVLQGRVAGVSVDAQGGPGDVAVVRIRGFGSNGNNDVLYVIDGVQMRGGSNLVNPNDIETITVLKDPSNTALYGAQGGNGVIVITTKTGKRGLAPKLEYNGYGSWETPIDYPSVLSPQQFADAYFGYLKNSNLTTSDANNIYGTGSSAVLPDYLIERSITPTFLVANEGSAEANSSLYNLSSYRILKANKQGTDWFREIFNPVFSHNHQLTLSGATDKSNYSLGLGYLDNQGVVLATNFKRYSFRVNTEFKPKDWLKIGENVTFSYTQGAGVGGNNHNPSGFLSDLYRRSPLVPIYDIAGNYSGAKGFPVNNIAFVAGGNNPVFGQINGKETYKNYNAGVIGSAFVDIEPQKGLVLESRVGAQFYPYSYHYFLDTFPQNSFSATYNSFTEGSGHSGNLRWTNKLSYDRRIGMHKVSAFIAYEASKGTSRNSQATVTNLLYTTPGYLNLSNGSSNINNPPGGGSAMNTTTSFFGNVNYSYAEKYLLSFVARRDGSSQFGPLHRYGNFFSYSGGWRISKENFLSNVDWISDLKLRVAYGENGNDAIPDHLYEDIYTINPSYSGAFNYSSYDLGGTNDSALLGAGINQLGNPYIHWETNKTTNVGFDAALFKSKLTVSFSWFNRTTKDLLAVVPVSGLLGDGLAPFQNVMRFSNKGIEVELGYNNNFGKVAYDMNFNISTYRNRVEHTDDFEDPLIGGSYGSTHLNLNKSVVGMPVSSFFGLVKEGIFQSGEEYTKYGVTEPGLTGANAAGHFKFRDINGDKKIDDNDRTFIGSPHPKFSAGYNLNVSYKNFDVAIFLQGVWGNKIFNYWRAYTVFPGMQGKGADDTWSPSNTGAKLPVWDKFSAVTKDAAPSDFFVEDGSYLRLKSLQLGYTLPSGRAFNKLRIYVQGYNLATFTKYTGIDPEITTGGVDSYGIDFGGNYPLSTKIIFGVNLGL